MRREVRASICWSSSKQTLPLVGTRYVTVARWPDDDGPTGAWSIIARVISGPDHNRCSDAWISFLMDGAPHDQMANGATFELLEGSAVVAVVTVR